MATTEYRESAPGAEVMANAVLPLTAAQRGMWFAERLSPDYSVNIAQYVDIRHEPGGIDIDLLERCCVEVGKLMESPYVRLAEVDGVPVQYVDLDFDQHVDILDFRDEPDPVEAAFEWMQAEYRRPVDLLNDQFIVIAILQIADDRTFWYNRAHHIIIDGYAALSIMRRTVDRYNSLRRGDEPKDKMPASMADIVAYEDAYRSSSRRATDREHWLSRVADLPERVTLAHAAASVPLSFDNVVASEPLDPALQGALMTLARELNTSIAVLMTAAFGAFLSRMSGADDIVMSLPVTGRATAKIKMSGGMVSNILPIRLNDVSDKTGLDLIAAAQLELTGALRHQRYRSDDIRRDAGADDSSVSFGPTINMVFFDEQVAIDGTTMEYRILTSGILEDLLINLYQSSPDAPLVVDLHGNPHLYNSTQMESHHRRFLNFVEQFIGGINSPIRDLDLLLTGEIEKLSGLGRGPEQTWNDPGRTILDDFTARAAQNPEATALVLDGRTWTYREFDALRSSLAHQLYADGVRPGDRVVVALDRGIGQVCAIYATMTLGAAYVPVDPQQPDERRRHIVATAGPALIIDADYLGRVGFDDRSPIPDRPRTPVEISLPHDLPAYVIFTSGSTGTPKGVEVGHAALANRLRWMQENYPISEVDAVLYKTPFTFDVSVWELFWPMQIGARMVIAAPGGHRDPDYLANLIRSQGVSVLHFVPSMLHTFVDVVQTTGDLDVFPDGVRLVFASGEALGRPLADRVLVHSAADLINLYGPTEAAVDITEHVVSPGSASVPIGRPVANSDVYVLDSALRPVPAGVAGELYLAGSQLAFGYVGSPDLTAGRFVANPFSQTAGRRMYRTGDLVRWNDDGELEYLGRSDFQVKIRGQRVELGEIETVLGELPAVEGAVVVARTDLTTSPMLVAYLTVGDKGVDQAALLVDSRRRLPSHMVPAAFVVLDEFPVNSSGKLDRKALPTPVVGRSEITPFVAPSSPIERQVVALVEDLLGVERIGLRDNIFSLGADSLVAARLASRLRSTVGVRVDLGDIFESRTIGDLIATAEPLGQAASRGPDLVRIERPDPIPLSYPQTRLWFINRLDPTAGTYNIPGAVRLGGDVDIDAMRAAINDVIARHEPLRTTFPDRDGESFQLIHTTFEAAGAGLFELVDVPPIEVDSRVAALVTSGFDLVDEFPVRARLFRSLGADGATDHVLVIVLHHIIGDGASLGPLINDVVTAYSSRAGGATPVWDPLPVQYADFTVWQRAMLGDEHDPDSLLSRQIDFWRRELDEMPELIGLPTDRPRPAAPTGRGGFLDTWIDAEAVVRLRAVAAEYGVTMFAVVHSALALVLARLSDRTDIAIGTAVAGRDEPELADLIGMFVNTVVLRTHVRPADTVEDLLNAAHHTRAQALSHADVPFEQVVNAVGAKRSRSHSPLFQVELVMQHDQVLHLLDAESAIGVIDARAPYAKYDLSLNVIDYGDTGSYANQISVAFSYAEDLFDRSSVERFAGYFRGILDRLTDGSMPAPGETRVDDLLQFPAAELSVVRGLAQGRAVDVPQRNLHEAVSTQVAATPAATALVFGDRSVSYAEFGARVNQLARQLMSLGVGSDIAVGVCIPRSVDLLVAVHGVVAAGAHYVPLDVDAPADRVEYMTATAGVRVVLVDSRGTPDVVAALGDRLTVVGIDTTAEVDLATAAVSDTERAVRLRTDNAAYTLFTSGSTGRPKGVTVSHAAIMNRLAWMQGDHALSAADVVLQKTPVTFDVSVWELFWPLTVGASVVIAEPNRHGDPVYLAGIIEEERVSTVHFVPSMLSVFVDVLGSARLARFDSLRLMFTSGEALTAATAQAVLAAAPVIGLHNLYGPTEAAVDVTDFEVAAGQSVVPIGRPVWNTSTYVLDSRLRLVPAGVVGELYLGGVQLARGYASAGGRTAERFIADPFGAPGERLYRTGDLVKWNSSGQIEYLGRNDFQVKLRGQRLELGEIEAVVAAVAGVVHVAATVASVGGGEQLVAYVSPESVDLDTLKAAVSERLPEYMRPTIWVPLDAMPLSSAGKIDRKALPDPELATSDYVAPRSEAEQAIAAVYADVLGVEQVSIIESFFDLGGNSLSATKVAARLSTVLDRDIPVSALFDAPSVRAMSDYAAAVDSRHRKPSLVPRARTGAGPLSSIQRGMWLVNRADPASPAYNVAMALRLRGTLDLVALHSALEDLVARHESLRTRYPMIDGEPTQIVLSTGEAHESIERQVVDVTGGLDEVIAGITGRGFDVTTAPPLRLAVLALSDDEHVLVFVVHHISADGASMLPLARDVIRAYSARSAQSPPDWEPLSVQYLDFALWQREWLESAGPGGVLEEQRQLDYWIDRLSGAPARVELPADRPRPRTPSYAGDEVLFEVSGELVHDLETVAKENNATLFMVMHAAFAVLLSRLSNQRDIVIGTPYAGRGEQDLDDLVGMFVNTLALRTHLRDDEKFGELLQRIRDDDLSDMANADVAFDTIASSVLTSQPTSYNPVYQVMFAFQNFYFPSLELENLTITPVSEQLTSAKVDLQLTVYPNDPALELAQSDAMRAQMIYATDLFDPLTVELYSQRFIRVLEDVARDPQILIGDISISTPAEILDDEVIEDEQLTSLPDLVHDAAQRSPDAAAIRNDGAVVTFASLSTMTTAMGAALPDPDSAMTTALMSLVPGLASAGPDRLGEVLHLLRVNAYDAVGTDALSTTTEGMTKT